MPVTAFPSLLRKAKSYTFGRSSRSTLGHLQIIHTLKTLRPSDAQAKLDHYNAELARLNEASAALTRQRNEVERLVSVYDNYQRQVSQFSDETLQIIFFFAMLDDPVCASLSISWTCQRWRSVALSLPQLWSRIFVYPTTEEKLVELFLTRSLSLPLDITIDCVVDHGPNALLALYDASARWLTAKIALPSASVGLMDTYIQGNTSILQELELDFYDMYGNSAGTPKCEAFKEATTLRTLRLSRSLPVADIQLPWWNLDVVEFTRSYDGPDLLALDELAYAFLPLTFIVSGNPFQRFHTLSSNRKFGHLNTFILTVWNASVAAQMAKLVLPDLKVLEFDLGNQLDDTSYDAFEPTLQSLIHGSNIDNRLQRLKLAGNFEENHVITALNLCPYLEELVLRETDVGCPYMITGDVMVLLTLPSEVCPMLRKIELLWNLHSEDGQRWAPPMIHSRLIRHDLEYRDERSHLVDDIRLGIRGGWDLYGSLLEYAQELKDVPGVHVWLI